MAYIKETIFHGLMLGGNKTGNIFVVFSYAGYAKDVDTRHSTSGGLAQLKGGTVAR